MTQEPLVSKTLLEKVPAKVLAEVLDIARCLRQRAPQANEAFYQRQQQRLKDLQAKLATYRLQDITDDLKPVDTIPLPVRQTFARAALLVRRYHQLAGHQWQGTLESPTLSKQVPDQIPSVLESEDAIASLCTQFQLNNQVALGAMVQQVDQRIARQAAIIHSVLSSVGIDAPAPQNSKISLRRIQAAALFKHLFGITLPAIDIVYTPLQIYFCLPAADLAAQVPATEQPRLKELSESMDAFSFDQFRRFPTFGPCQPKHINTAWATPIAQELNESVDSIIGALSHSVSVLPTDKAETFLIHDIWGHYWQLMMTQFQADYAILAHCDSPLRAGETAYTDQGPVACRELFHPNGDEVTLDEAKAHDFFHGEVRQRLGLVFTHLIAEMMADVAEFKFVWRNPDATNELPSSSVFKTAPVKLDLSLIDLDFLFIRVINPLMEINISALNTSPLEQEILSIWQQQGIRSPSLELRTHLKQKLSRLHEIFLDDYRQQYLSSLKSTTGIFGQAATNLVYLQNTINHLCVEACQDVTADFDQNSPQPPLYHDLLMIFIGCFCSGDSYSNFWQMDAVLADHFLPCWHLLHQWIQHADSSHSEDSYAR
ncbi:MAG: hypothetical protein AAF151_16900 [Cyanobacteria bacterium J06656_5]